MSSRLSTTLVKEHRDVLSSERSLHAPHVPALAVAIYADFLAVFPRRFHPILKRHRPHLGIDYAAPLGTPVQSVDDGVVTWVGSKGSNGKMVAIQHNRVYSTYYLHLSRFANDMQVDDRVTQGQIIGYVGSTGLSTGPHLGFRMTKNGRFLNPLGHDNVEAQPLPREVLPVFRAYAKRLLVALNTATGR